MNISESISKNDLFLIFSEAAIIKQEDLGIVSQLVKMDYNTIVITSNQPYTNLVRIYEENNIDMSNIVIIDLITRYALGKEPENTNSDKCRYISNPANLTDIGIVINELLSNNNGRNSAVVFDSINTMLIYLSSDQLSRFIHLITNKFRLMGVKGFFLAVGGALDPALEVRFKIFMDIVIKS